MRPTRDRAFAQFRPSGGNANSLHPPAVEVIATPDDAHAVPVAPALQGTAVSDPNLLLEEHQGAGGHVTYGPEPAPGPERMDEEGDAAPFAFAPVAEGLRKVKLTAAGNEAKTTEDELAMHLLSSAEVEEIPVSADEIMVLLHSQTGPALVSGPQAFLEWLVDRENMTVITEEDESIAFAIVGCDVHGQPLVVSESRQRRLDADAEYQARRTERRSRRLTEEALTRRAFVTLPGEFDDRISRDGAPEAYKNLVSKQIYLAAAPGSIRRVNLVYARTKLGFRQPKLLAFVVFRNQEAVEMYRWSEVRLMLLPHHKLPARLDMPKDERLRLNLKGCCYRGQCRQTTSGTCHFFILRQGETISVGRSYQGRSEADEAAEELSRRAKRQRAKEKNAERHARTPCDTLALGRCGYGSDCCYLHPSAADVAKIECCSSSQRGRPRLCSFKAAGTCPYANHDPSVTYQPPRSQPPRS